MSDDANHSTGYKPKPRKPAREALNIQFANGLSTDEILKLLQHELLRARDKKEEVALPAAIVHSIKYRLKWYLNVMGEIDEESSKHKEGGKTDND